MAGSAAAAAGGRYYQQIVRDLRERIDSEELRPGAQIPTEKELTEQYHVSRNTVRRAISALASAGLLDTGSTRGIFVRKWRPLVITATRYERDRGVSARDAISDEIEAQGREQDREFTLQIIPAVKKVADRLNVVVDTLVVLRRELVYIDDRPSIILDSFYPKDLAEDTELLKNGDITRGTIAVLKEIGHEEKRHKDEILTRPPTDEEGRLLQLGVGIPVLDWKRTAYSEARPVRFTWRICAGDAVELVYELGEMGPVPR
jgi:GntR family transcriptional regulator